jgi:GxxExxY protein
MKINDLTHKIIGSAYKVHNVLGPGFLEKVYENALKLELDKLGIDARQQGKLPVWYDGQRVGVFYPDLWIEGQLIVEVKAVQTLIQEHEMQLIHYLAATGIDNGLLINFSASVQVKRKFREFRSKDLPCAAFLAVSLE